MNVLSNSFPDATAEAGKGFSVVIACEDSFAAAPACEVLELVERHLKAEGRLIYQWWNFEVLAITSLRELASREAATADLIIIAAHEGRALPQAVTDWMKRWLDLRKDQSGALVAVLDSGPKKTDPAPEMLSQLKKTAALGHLDFFAFGGTVGKRGAGVARRASQATRQFVMACTNRCAARIAGRRGTKLLPHPDKPTKIAVSL